MRMLACSILAAYAVVLQAQDQLEINATIDGMDRIVITRTNASWSHLSGDLNLTSATLNGMAWKPGQNPNLSNSGATTFLTNGVNFLSAVMDVSNARDTVVLEREPSRLILSFADTPGGSGNYHVVIRFRGVPTLAIRATIDGSDELHVSYSGARWLHKQWAVPTSVFLNGVPWNPSNRPYLTNSGANLFLPAPVAFGNAVVLSSSGRGLLTMRPAADGVIVNFADDALGAGAYEMVIGFPPGESVRNAAIPAISSASISLVPAAGIGLETLRGVQYELQSTTNINTSAWQSTGSFIRGNGGTMLLFDPMTQAGNVFYRIVSAP